MALYRDQGVVLRTIKLGETDRIITLLTQGHGKVRAVAKGVRRPGSRFGARLEPTNHVAVQLYEGRELDVVTQVETVDANREVREHYGQLTHAIAMLEATDQVAQEREPNPALYRMLAGALRTLAKAPGTLVAPAFFWKLLSLEGFEPMLTVCVQCGDEEGPFPSIDLGEGGVVCGSCASFGGRRRLQPDTLATLADLLNGGLARALNEPPSPEVVHELETLAIAALEWHFERRLRSAALL